MRYIDKKTAQLNQILSYLESFKDHKVNGEDKEFYEMLEDDIRRNRDCKYYCKVLRLIIDNKFYNFILSKTLNPDFCYKMIEWGYLEEKHKLVKKIVKHREEIQMSVTEYHKRIRQGLPTYEEWEEEEWVNEEYLVPVKHIEQIRGDYEKYGKPHSIMQNTSQGNHTMWGWTQKWWL